MWVKILLSDKKIRFVEDYITPLGDVSETGPRLRN